VRLWAWSFTDGATVPGGAVAQKFGASHFGFAICGLWNLIVCGWLPLRPGLFSKPFRIWVLNSFWVGSLVVLELPSLGCVSDGARKDEGFVIIACFRLVCGRNLIVRCKWWGREVDWFRVGGQFHLSLFNWIPNCWVDVLDISSPASSSSSDSQPTVVVILEVVVVLQGLIRDALLCWFRCFWMVVAILGYNFQYSSPRRKEGLIWSVLWGSKERLSCCALQGEDGTWIWSMLTVAPFTAV